MEKICAIRNICLSPFLYNLNTTGKPYLKIVSYRNPQYRPGQAPRVPGGQAPRFYKNRRIKVVRSSAPCTRHLYPPGNMAGTHFCQRVIHFHGHSAARMVMSMKNSNRPVGIKPMTIQFVMQCLHQLRHCVPRLKFVVFNFQVILYYQLKQSMS